MNTKLYSTGNKSNYIGSSADGSSASVLTKQILDAQSAKSALQLQLATAQKALADSAESGCYGIKPDSAYNSCLDQKSRDRNAYSTQIQGINAQISAQDKIITDTLATLNAVAPNDPAVVQVKAQLQAQTQAIDADKSKTMYWVIGGIVVFILIIGVWLYIRKRKK